MHPARSSNQDVRLFVQHSKTLLLRYAALQTLRCDVQALGEAVKLLLDLLGQLSSVAHDYAREWLGVCHAVEHDEDEDGGFATAGFGLAEDVHSE